mmetsp:Transcript_48691/g.67646  ORF Transcript_48691/g.67646 Transcript_48691/m.67646 type:complete len:84 (-) Transcript_48691:170-421(-)
MFRGSLVAARQSTASRSFTRTQSISTVEVTANCGRIQCCKKPWAAVPRHCVGLLASSMPTAEEEEKGSKVLIIYAWMQRFSCT